MSQIHITSGDEKCIVEKIKIYAFGKWKVFSQFLKTNLWNNTQFAVEHLTKDKPHRNSDKKREKKFRDAAFQ